MSAKQFESQNNYGWGLTFDMTGKVPIINKRIFDKLTDAQAFADDYNDSAIEGLLLSVINDGVNNGVYFVQKIKSNKNDEPASLIKLGTQENINTSNDILNKTVTAVNTLIGDVNGDNTKSVRDIAVEEVTKILDGVDDKYDTLKEIADYISSDETNAAQMVTNIEEIQKTMNGYSSSNTIQNNINELQQNLSDEIDVIKNDITNTNNLIGTLPEENTVVGFIEESTVLQQDIVVAGLQTDIGIYGNGNTIAKGTSIYEIIQNMLCKEIYPDNVMSVSASASVSMDELTLELNHSGTIEVGTMVKLITAKTNGTNVSSSPSKIIGMSDGYSELDDNVRDFEDTSIIKECSTDISDNDYTISCTINIGFNAEKTPNTPESQTGEGYAELNECEIGCVVEGENKITINATGASYSYEADAIPKIYYCSNLGKTKSNKFHSGVSAINGVTDKAIAIPKVETVIGKYKYFMGTTQKDKNNITSDDITKFNIKGFLNIDAQTIVSSWDAPGYSKVIACPSKYKLESIKDNNNFEQEGMFNLIKELELTTGKIKTNYSIYVWEMLGNDSKKFNNIKFNKK